MSKPPITPPNKPTPEPGDNAVPDYSGPATRELNIHPPGPVPRAINRRIVWGGALISGLLAVGVVYASIHKQRSITENARAPEKTATISQSATGPGSAANLPSSYAEFRAYQKRKDAEGAADAKDAADTKRAAEAARRARISAAIDPQLPASLQPRTKIPAASGPPPAAEATYNENDPRLMAARQAAMQRLNARTAAKSGGSNIRPQNAGARATRTPSSAAGASPMTLPGFPQLPGAGDEVLQANDQKAKVDYLAKTSDNRIYINHGLVEPVSPYQVMAGNIIPVSLVTGLNSDLPGFLIAQVRHNVYDSVTGRHLLIPQGTRILGEYSSSITYGQNRALVIWNRLIYPSGRSILLDGMPGVDLSGNAGLRDKVDRHFWQLMGSAILGSLVATGADAAQGDNPHSMISNALSGAATTADQTIQQIVKKQLNVQPTIKIRPSYRFNILVLADMVLAPYDAATSAARR